MSAPVSKGLKQVCSIRFDGAVGLIVIGHLVPRDTKDPPQTPPAAVAFSLTSLVVTATASSASGTPGRYVYSVIRATRPCLARSTSFFLSGCVSGIGMDTGG